MENTEYKLINKETGERLSAPLHQNEMIHTFNHNQFGKIRTMVDESGEWFVARDVVSKLGYKEPHKAIQRHVDDDDKKKYGLWDETSRQVRNVTLINESGLYSLTLSSKLQTAKAFKKWVTSEILPSIRKTGTYSVPSQAPTDMASLMMMSQQTANLINNTVSIFSQEIVKVNDTLDEIKTEISTWDEKTDNERNNRRISYAQTTVDFPAKVKQMVYMASGAEVDGKTRIYQSAKKYLLHTLLDVNRANDIILGDWAHIDELIANNCDDWYAGYLRKLEEERLKRIERLKAKKNEM